MNHALTSRLHWVYLAVSVPFVYAMTLMWWFPSGDKYFPVVAGVCILAFIGLRGWQYRDAHISAIQRPMLWLVVLLAIDAAAVYDLFGGSISELRALTAAGFYLMIASGFRISQKLWRLTVIASSLGFIGLCTWQYVFEGMHRANGFYNSIPFANGLAVMLVASSILSLTGSGKAGKTGFGLLSALLLLALAMTGTRGVILPVAIIFFGCATIYIFRAFRIRLVRRWLSLGAFIVLFAVAAHMLKPRLDATQIQIAEAQSEERLGSIGLRLQFWEAATMMVDENPIIGVGEGHRQLLSDLYAKGLVSDAVKNYAPYHYHNQYLDILVKRGAIGLVLFLLLLLLPVALAYTRRGPGGSKTNFMEIIAAIYAVASLTDVPFNHAVTIYMYCLPIFLVALPGNEQSHDTRRS